MDDGYGVNAGSGTQFPGHDIGPDEDRFSNENGIPIDMLYTRTNSHGEMEIDIQPVFVARHSNGRFYEPLDETPYTPEPVQASVSFPRATDEKFFSEANRLKTFEERWLEDYHVTPADLAKDGFIHIGPGDKVKCVFCLRTLRNWEPNDSVEREHRKHYPDCPFVRGACDDQNIPINPVDSMNKAMGLKMKLSDQSRSPAELPMQDLSDRLRSYQKWPRNAPVRPDALAAAGFYYSGSEDRVKCFSCKSILENWEPGDDPWVEHTKWAPTCAYLHAVKGSEYVQSILHQGMNSESSAGNLEGKNEQAASKINNSGAAYIKKEDTVIQRPLEKEAWHLSRVSSAQIDKDLKNPAVMAICETYSVPKELMRKMLEEIHQTNDLKSSPVRDELRSYDVPLELMRDMLSKIHLVNK